MQNNLIQQVCTPTKQVDTDIVMGSDITSFCTGLTKAAEEMMHQASNVEFSSIIKEADCLGDTQRLQTCKHRLNEVMYDINIKPRGKRIIPTQCKTCSKIACEEYMIKHCNKQKHCLGYKYIDFQKNQVDKYFIKRQFVNNRLIQMQRKVFLKEKQKTQKRKRFHEKCVVECNVCNFFFTRANIRRHIKDVHKIDENRFSIVKCWC